MKQKILIRVSMTDDRTRAKAMQTVVQFKGVSGAEIKGDHRNQIEVIGVEVNMICLINTLRKKVAFAELVSVNKVEPPKKPEEKKPEPCYLPWPYGYGYCVPSYYPHLMDGDKKPDEDKKPDGDNKPDDKKPDEKKPEPCYQPWPYGYGVASSYPHPCDPYGYNGRDYTGEPVYNHEPGCRVM